jgi:hypothetical protein
MHRACLLLSLCIAFALSMPSKSEAQSNSSWLDFRSPSGFQVQYPSDWFRFGTYPKNLDIISTPYRVEATIIPKGAQMIAVYEDAPVTNDNYLSFYRQKVPEDKILGYNTLNVGRTSDNSCSKIYIIESTDEVSPGTNYLEHHMYCRIKSRTFVLALTQWQSDGSNNRSYDLSIQILKTLKANTGTIH